MDIPTTTEKRQDRSGWVDVELTGDAYEHLKKLTSALNQACGTDLNIHQMMSLIVLLAEDSPFGKRAQMVV